MAKNISTADIILIEDNISDADLALRAFRKTNLHLNVVHFEDGSEALESLFSQFDEKNEPDTPHLPHLVLLDLKLPGLHGKDILRALKENKKTRKIPVVMLTSSNQHSDVSDCYQLGCNAYIVKPLEFDEYVRLVSEAVSFWVHVNYMPDEFS